MNFLMRTKQLIIWAICRNIFNVKFICNRSIIQNTTKTIPGVSVSSNQVYIKTVIIISVYAHNNHFFVNVFYFASNDYSFLRCMQRTFFINVVLMPWFIFIYFGQHPVNVNIMQVGSWSFDIKTLNDYVSQVYAKYCSNI